ncbi:MAG: asparagine synthase (glutamine-hydrolyzing) [Ferruginibacter sp.]
MCGISGILSAEKEQLSFYPLKKMLQAIAHRGPDGEGVWQNETKDVLLGHRRLAVIDLTPAAAQPMHYLNRRYSIVHNGEIYNYKELRSFLQQQDYSFVSQSDTEVILAAYDFWKERCLQHFDGMFAFAIWDEKEKVLFAARDRFGEKPFYYFENGPYFLFASEIKALWAAGVEKEMEEKMLLNYLALGQVQNAADKEYTFYKNIWALPPAHYLKYTPALQKLSVKQYWQLDKENQIDITSAAAVEKFNTLFLNSVKKRLRSDVPVGTSLSGGIDSASIAAAINGIGRAGGLQKSFSAVFPGYEKDETAFINLVADKLKIENSKTIPQVNDLVQQFEAVCRSQDEPFASSSIFAQYKVFELAAGEGIKVLLDGQGADEILAGYHKYIRWYLQDLLTHSYAAERKKLVAALRQNQLPHSIGFKNYIAALLPMHAAMYLERKEYHMVKHQPDLNPEFLYQHLRGKEWEGIHKAPVTKLNDILHYNVTELGLEELLRYADRNSMAHGREVRLPFLDHTLVEFVFSLPPTLKINEGYTKWLLRKTMEKKLPQEIVWRKDKVGYEPPQKQWMESPLLQDLIRQAKQKLVDKGLLHSKVLNKKIIPGDAVAANNHDWRYLCAAQFY